MSNYKSRESEVYPIYLDSTPRPHDFSMIALTDRSRCELFLRIVGALKRVDPLKKGGRSGHRSIGDIKKYK